MTDITCVVLTDGSDACVRRLLASDRQAVDELFARADPQDVYTRFFTLGGDVVSRHVEHLFAADSSAITYVLERAGRVLGVAEVEPEGEESAEVAFLVASGAHGLGIGTVLLERAAADAWSRGTRTFVADVLTTNYPMIEVFRDAGFDVDVSGHHNELSVRMSTRATAEAVAAARERHERALARRTLGGFVDPGTRVARRGGPEDLGPSRQGDGP